MLASAEHAIHTHTHTATYTITWTRQATQRTDFFGSTHTAKAFTSFMFVRQIREMFFRSFAKNRHCKMDEANERERSKSARELEELLIAKEATAD